MFRFATAVTVVCLMSLHLVLTMLPSGHGSLQRCGSASEADLCASHDTMPLESGSINDSELKQRIERLGGRLVSRGETTSMQVLMQGLKRGRCRVELATASMAEESPDDLYHRVKKSIVVVSSLYQCDDCNQWHGGTATGFVVSSAGVIVTNHHVVDSPDEETLVVMTSDGSVIPVTRILAASADNDLAVLQVAATDLVPLAIADHPASVGTEISVISHPAERFYSYTSGVVSRYTRLRLDSRPVECMSITADYARGSSGAPVLNDSGQVVGIVMSTDSIYYSVEHGQQKDLQMVFKTCIPSASLMEMLTPSAH